MLEWNCIAKRSFTNNYKTGKEINRNSTAVGTHTQHQICIGGYDNGGLWNTWLLPESHFDSKTRLFCLHSDWDWQSNCIHVITSQTNLALFYNFKVTSFAVVTYSSYSRNTHAMPVASTRNTVIKHAGRQAGNDSEFTYSLKSQIIPIGSIKCLLTNQNDFRTTNEHVSSVISACLKI